MPLMPSHSHLEFSDNTDRGAWSSLSSFGWPMSARNPPLSPVQGIEVYSTHYSFVFYYFKILRMELRSSGLQGRLFISLAQQSCSKEQHKCFPIQQQPEVVGPTVSAVLCPSGGSVCFNCSHSKCFISHCVVPQVPDGPHLCTRPRRQKGPGTPWVSSHACQMPALPAPVPCSV